MYDSMYHQQLYPGYRIQHFTNVSGPTVLYEDVIHLSFAFPENKSSSKNASRKKQKTHNKALTKTNSLPAKQNVVQAFYSQTH